MQAADHDDEEEELTTVGFLGCGTIASAMVTGLLNGQSESALPFSSLSSLPKIKNVIVTRRSKHQSAKLLLQFPNQVLVTDSNQEVLDKADIIFLTVLPKQVSAVLKELEFESRHTLVSLVATSNLASLSFDSKLPKENVFKLICLPAVAYNEGVCLLQIPQEWYDMVERKRQPNFVPVLERLGEVVIARNDQQMSAMMVTSGLMGNFYGMLRNNRDWLMQETGLSSDGATRLVIRTYHGMMQDAMRKFDLDELIAEQTPGGLNEQALANAEALGSFDMYNKVQDALLRRISGQSDGSL